MSMISAQCDELRRLASTLDTRYRYADDIATALRKAADTIFELRDDLQRANAAVQDAEHDESCAWDRVRKAEAEADRLRELVRELYEIAQPEAPSMFEAEFADRMRELGVEVDR